MCIFILRLHILFAFDHLKSGKKDHTSFDSIHFHLAVQVLAESLSGFSQHLVSLFSPCSFEGLSDCSYIYLHVNLARILPYQTGIVLFPLPPLLAKCSGSALFFNFLTLCMLLSTVWL